MREFWKNGAILPSLEQELPPFPSLLHAGGWGHTALQGGQYGPILAPGRVAWPHFEMGPCYPPLLLTANHVQLATTRLIPYLRVTSSHMSPLSLVRI